MNEDLNIPKEYLGKMRRADECIDIDTCGIAIAAVTGLRSKDPSTLVGACFVNDRGRILSVGYNGAPNGWDDDDFTWKTDMEEEYNKYSYVVHGEMNAIFNYSGPLTDLR